MSNKIHLFTAEVTTRWSDIDGYGVVNHAAFFTLMEEARIQWLGQENLLTEQRYAHLIVEANVKYFQKLEKITTVYIKLFSQQPDEKTWFMHHEIYSDAACQKLHAQAWTQLICYDIKEKKACAIPDSFLQRLGFQVYDEI